MTKDEIASRIVSSEVTEVMKVEGPENSYELSYAYLSQRGYYPNALGKPNQDAFSVDRDYNGERGLGLWGVYDGHGGSGDLVANFAREEIPRNLVSEMKKRGACFQNLTEEEIMDAHKAAFITTNTSCHAAPFDSSLSGTTAITLLVQHNTIYVNNVGDSRAVIAVEDKTTGKVTAEHLSIDQTPFRKDERERVKLCGAKVMTIDQIEGAEPVHENWGLNLGEEVDESGDPPRVWEANLQVRSGGGDTPVKREPSSTL